MKLGLYDSLKCPKRSWSRRNLTYFIVRVSITKLENPFSLKTTIKLENYRYTAKLQVNGEITDIQ